MEIIKEKTVAFTGYREQKILNGSVDCDIFNRIADELYSAIISLCEQGYTTFMSGMAEGFDILAAESVVKAKERYPEIRLIAVIPFLGQERGFQSYNRTRYKNLFESADERIVTADTYHKKAFLDRNDFMLNHASVVVCYYDGQRGGTMYTYNRAVKKKLNIINICKK